MTRRAIIGGVIFLAVILGLSYLLLRAEALTSKELTLVERLESDIAASLQQKATELFPPATRMAGKFQIGGSPPKIYKLKCTSGRPGRRLTMDLSIQRNTGKAVRKFATRWKHELRAHRLGTLAPVSLPRLDPTQSRLAQIRLGNGDVVGVFFLARVDRGLFSLTLKGITLSEIPDFVAMIKPTMDTLESSGATLMVED